MNTASTRGTCQRRHCDRRSGPASNKSPLSPNVTKAADRHRRSRGSLLWQTAHVHPIKGTPTDVPVPKKRKVKAPVSMASTT